MARGVALDVQSDNKRHYVRGPGRSRRSAGPVLEAYAEADLSCRCANCGAAASSFCVHPDGTARKVPCMQRMVTP